MASRASGLTLVELLVVLAIAAILLALGVPSFQSVIRTNRLSAATDNFVASLNLARGEAVRLGCPVNVASLSAANNWGVSGWNITPVASAALAPTQSCPAGTVLRTVAAVTAPTSIYGDVAVISFDPTGRASGPAVFVVCLDGTTGTLANASRAVLVSASGRIRIANNNSTGVPLKDNGATVGACNGP
jgi:prepilin-type N-terminal cleavage/methylation domain-containing protein